MSVLSLFLYGWCRGPPGIEVYIEWDARASSGIRPLFGLAVFGLHFFRQVYPLAMLGFDFNGVWVHF